MDVSASVGNAGRIMVRSREQAEYCVDRIEVRHFRSVQEVEVQKGCGNSLIFGQSCHPFIVCIVTALHKIPDAPQLSKLYLHRY